MRIIVTSAVLLVLQLTVAPRIALGEIAPDFPLLLVIYYAVFAGPVRGTVAGFLIGFIQDLFSPELLGLNALTKTILGFTLGHVGAKTESDHVVLLATLFFVGAIVHDFVYLLIFTGTQPLRFLALLVTNAIPSAVYTTVAGIVVHVVVSVFGFKAVRPLGKTRS